MWDFLKQVVWSPLSIFLSGLCFPVVIEWARRWLFFPRLEAVSVGIKEAHVPGSDNKPYPASYVRVGVKNTSLATAKNAMALLTRIEVYAINEFRDVEFFEDTLRLRWAYEPQEADLHRGVDIPHNVLFHFGILSIKRDNDSPTRIIQCADKYLRFNPKGGLINRIEQGKKYRFHIALSSENAATKPMVVEVEIGSAWEPAAKDMTG